MNQIFNKIFSIYFLVLVLFTGVVLFITFSMISNHYIDTLTINLEGINSLAQDRLSNDISRVDLIDMEVVALDIAKKTNTRVTVISPEGQVWADTEKDPKLMENHAGRVEVIGAMSGKLGSSVRYSNTVNKQMLYVAMPFKLHNRINAVVRVSMYIDYINELNTVLRDKILFIAGISILIAIIIIYFFSKNITEPISDFVMAANKVASGDFNTKVIIKNTDELKNLADGFNFMTDQVKHLFEEQTMQQEELRRIITSMQEGLIVLDKDNKIVLHNKSFKKIVNSNNIDNKSYWEILRDINVQNLVERVRRKKSHKSAEIKIDNVFYLFSANYIQTKDEIVLVLFDISERKKIEDMKRDFIVNASHELRTPLTAIKGYVETMEDEAQAEKRDVKYLEVIKRHTSRLIAIVEDLLSISKLEDERTGLELNEIDFYPMMKNIMTIFDERARDSGLKIQLKLEDDLGIFKGDQFKIEQLLINLIDNAIKYTQSGKVIITVREEEDSFIMDVSDTGIGIPAIDLDRIFERFYTVEKSRSRKVGGTGLGLSIVKHIVQLHKGTINVKSVLGQGSSFIVSLPKV